MNDLITCPNCGREIQMQAAAAARMRERIMQELEAGVRMKKDALARRENSLQQKEQTLDADLQSRLNAEMARLRKEIEKATHSAYSQEVEELQAKLDTANTAEVGLRKDRRALEEQKRELELAVNRKLDEELESLREQARVQIAEQNRHLDAHEETLIGDLRGQIDDMKRNPAGSR